MDSPIFFQVVPIFPLFSPPSGPYFPPSDPLYDICIF